MKEIYEEASIELIKISAKDILTASIETGSGEHEDDDFDD